MHMAGHRIQNSWHFRLNILPHDQNHHLYIKENNQNHDRRHFTKVMSYLFHFISDVVGGKSPLAFSFCYRVYTFVSGYVRAHAVLLTSKGWVTTVHAAKGEPVHATLL